MDKHLRRTTWSKTVHTQPYNPTADYRMLFVVTEDKRDFAAWLKKVFAPWKPKKTRGLEEDEAPTSKYRHNISKIA